MFSQPPIGKTHKYCTMLSVGIQVYVFPYRTESEINIKCNEIKQPPLEKTPNNFIKITQNTDIIRVINLAPSKSP